MTDLIRPKDIFAEDFVLTDFQSDFGNFLLQFTEISEYEIERLIELTTLLITEYRSSSIAGRKQVIAYILSCYIKGTNPKNRKYTHKFAKKNPKPYSAWRDQIIDFVIGIDSEGISNYVMIGRTAFFVRGIPDGVNRHLKDFFLLEES